MHNCPDWIQVENQVTAWKSYERIWLAGIIVSHCTRKWIARLLLLTLAHSHTWLVNKCSKKNSCVKSTKLPGAHNEHVRWFNDPMLSKYTSSMGVDNNFCPFSQYIREIVLGGIFSTCSMIRAWRVPDTRPDPIIFGNTQSVPDFFLQNHRVFRVSGISPFLAECACNYTILF